MKASRISNSSAAGNGLNVIWWPRRKAGWGDGNETIHSTAKVVRRTSIERCVQRIPGALYSRIKRMPGEQENIMAERKLKGTDPKIAKPSKPKILIFGRPGVGKTWASIDFPSVYYIDTEGGANLDHYTDKLKKAGGAYFGPEQGSLDFDTVIEEVVSLATVKHEYRTLVIDSFSKLYNTERSRPPRRAATTSGGIRRRQTEPTRKLIRWLDKLDMNCILICHEKDKWQNGEGGVGQTFDGWDKLEYELHLALRITKAGASRKAKVIKTRLKEFPDAESFDWSYLEFAKKYGQDVIEMKSEPIAVASVEQVQKLTTLVEILRVDPDVIEKWKDKAGVDEFSEMDVETIQKCIDHLTTRLPKATAA
jgi:hypothetical protein